VEATDPIALHRKSCHQLLEQVRHGRRRISELRGHPLLIGHLYWKRPREFEWQKEEIAFARTTTRGADTGVSLDDQRLERINAVLRDRSLQVGLDFGTYGAFYSSVVASQARQPKRIRIGRDLRARVEWLCKTAGASVAAEHGPVALLDDRTLLRHFSAIPVPGALLAHHRALEREIRIATMPGRP
jgi:hypothetical protein